MNKKNVILICIMTLLIAIPPLTMPQVSGEREVIELYCGSLTVIGFGEDASVSASANNNLEIGLTPDGATVIFEVSYSMTNIEGDHDCAWCMMTGASTKECNAGSCSGSLSFTEYCYPGDSVDIHIEAIYADYVGWGWPLEWHINAEDDSYNTFVVEVPENQPPETPSKPSGNSDIKLGWGYLYPESVTCYYHSSTTDPEGNYLYYEFTCDSTGWIGPKPSGQGVSTSIVWDTPGNYYVKCQAIDVPRWPDYQEAKCSGFSEPLHVKVYYWWTDSAAYSDAVSFNVNPAVIQVFVPNPDPTFQMENAQSYGFFTDENDDGIYDTYYSCQIHDNVLYYDAAYELGTTYDSNTDAYYTDFDGDGAPDASVGIREITECTDGNPFD